MTERIIRSSGDELLGYLLFNDETFLDSPIVGTSDFAREFESRGIRDKQGRSLRDLKMKKRMFKYPCSYLIYSRAFDALPYVLKDYLYRRLFDILTGRDDDEAFDHLSTRDRRNILEILIETKKGLPDYWKI